MTNQEIFNTVASHLLKQGRPALSPDSRCRYRTEDGLKCAIGCLITDEHYNERLEARGISDGIVEEAVERSIGPLPDDIVSLLVELQHLHDKAPHNTVNFKESVPIELREIALKHDLDYSILNTLN